MISWMRVAAPNACIACAHRIEIIPKDLKDLTFLTALKDLTVLISLLTLFLSPVHLLSTLFQWMLNGCWMGAQWVLNGSSTQHHYILIARNSQDLASSIRHLEIECKDSNFFWYMQVFCLRFCHKNNIYIHFSCIYQKKAVPLQSQRFFCNQSAKRCADILKILSFSFLSCQSKSASFTNNKIVRSESSTFFSVDYSCILLVVGLCRASID